MSKLSGLVWVIGGLAFGIPLRMQAQAPSAHIAYVYPAGAKAGATLQIRVGGQTLDGVTNVYVSGPGVEASVVEYKKPLTQAQAKALREQLQELQTRRGAAMRGNGGKKAAAAKTASKWTPEDEKKFEEIRKKLAGFQRRPMNPALAETVIVQVKVDPGAPVGKREIRLGARLGLTNPMIFCIGDLPEFRKFEAPEGQQSPARRRPVRGAGETSTDPTDTRITLPGVVNGQMLQGGTDRFHFHARKGQKLVAMVSARDLIPYLADAVPGWFQPTLALHDASGKELAYNDDYQFRPDPVITCEIPHDGEYVIEIKDAIYRGREDFVYRIAVGELPFITSIFPLGGPAGGKTGVQLRGWNLPVTNVTEVCEPAENGLHPLVLPDNCHVLNAISFETGTLPEILEQEPNDSPGAARRVTLPLVINGRIDPPGGVDVFRFEGKAGQKLVAEVMARRLGSPLDSIVKLSDASGHQLAVNDDHGDPGSGLETHHADSFLEAALPADGSYYITIADVQGHGGPDYAYRLRLSAPQPDFALRVVPSSVNVRAGISVPLTVYALRKDGFTNAIRLELDGAHDGFSLSGARIPEGADQVRMTLTAPAGMGAGDKPASLSLKGSAIIGSRRIERPVVPADDMMQAFFYRHLVPAQELQVAVVGRSFGRGGPRLVESEPVRISLGGTARVRVAAPGGALNGRLQLELSDPPEGLRIKEVVPSQQGAEIVFESDPEKTKKGAKGNLIVAIVPGDAPAAAQKGKGQNNARRAAAVGYLPAIPFEVIPAS